MEENGPVVGVPAVPVPVPRKVAIVGFSDSSRELAPLSDPSFEKWGLGSVYKFLPPGVTWSRWFEMHDRAVLLDRHKDTLPDFIAHLAALPCDVFMLDVDPEIPNSKRYPIEDMTRTFFPTHWPSDRPFWTNTIQYMLASAIVERVDEIHVFGVDMAAAEEYVIQRPGVTYLIGWARAQGIKVFLPASCALMSVRTVYGYQNGDLWLREMEETETYLSTRYEEIRQLHERTLAQLHVYDGQMGEIRVQLERVTERKRGDVASRTKTKK